MKKALLVLLALTMAVSAVVLVPTGVAAADAQELSFGTVPADYVPDGTAVATAEDFAAMTADGKYYLSADIAITESYSGSFTGTFDGNGHTVTTTVPLFLNLDGTVKNLIIDGAITDSAVIDSTSNSKSVNGALARYAAFAADTVIENVRNNASMTSSYNGLAGIVGFGGNGSGYTLTIIGCANYGAITASTADVNRDSAGIIGNFTGKAAQFDLSIEDCVNYGIVNAGGRAAGIAGVIRTSAKLIRCINNGDIQAIGNYSAGIVGRLGEIDGTIGKTEFVVENCVNNATISYDGSKDAQIAGIAGYLGASKSVTFKACVNNGAIIANSGKELYVAGIVAETDLGPDNNGDHVKKTEGTLLFDGCVNNGKIVHTDWQKEAYAGGIAAHVISHYYVNFKDCINNADITCQAVDGPESYAGGMAGFVDYGIVTMTGCVNTGNITSSRRAAGIIARAYQKVISNLTLTGCGNSGDITGALAAGGLVAYLAANKDCGPFITYCYNNGDIKADKYAAGLLAYSNAGTGKISYCYVGGTVTNDSVTSVKNGDKVSENVHYTFEHDGVSYYFFAPMKGTVQISGTDVTVSELTAELKKAKTLASGKNAKAKTWYKCDIDGKTYYFYSEVKGKLEISGKSVKVGEKEMTLVTDTIPVYTHKLNEWALAYSNKRAFEIDMSTIYIEEGCADTDYIMGFEGKCLYLGGVGDASPRYPYADFISGKITYMLNEQIGRDVFYQNLHSPELVADEYPTTDATHAAVRLIGGKYANLPFEENPNCTPATGDSTIYAAVALGVSAFAFCGLLISKKKRPAAISR